MVIEDLLARAMQLKKGNRIIAIISLEASKLIKGQEYELSDNPTIICRQGNEPHLWKENYLPKPEQVINVLFPIRGKGSTIYRLDYTCFKMPDNSLELIT